MFYRLRYCFNQKHLKIDETFDKSVYQHGVLLWNGKQNRLLETRKTAKIVWNNYFKLRKLASILS